MPFLPPDQQYWSWRAWSRSWHTIYWSGLRSFGLHGLDNIHDKKHQHTHTQWHRQLFYFYCSSGICPGPPGWAGTRGKTRKVETNLHLLEQETVSGSGICWAICKSASHARQPRQHPTTEFLQAGCLSCRPTISVKALKATTNTTLTNTNIRCMPFFSVQIKSRVEI